VSGGEEPARNLTEWRKKCKGKGLERTKKGRKRNI